MTEQTCVIIKPDGVRRRLVGRIIQRFEDADLSIVALKKTLLSSEVVKVHYEHLKEQPFFPKLCAFMTESPVILMILEGEDAVSRVRKIVGATNPLKADSGSIRGQFATDTTRNLVHASDGLDTAAIEIKRFFS